MKKSEDEVSQNVQMAAPKNNCILLRNNSGAFKDETGRVVRFGLGNTSKEQNKHFKSSDFIGITTVTITADMVGKSIGVFTAVEIKEEGWKYSDKDKRAGAQKTFIEWVLSKGGYAGFSSDVDSFVKIIKG